MQNREDIKLNKELNEENKSILVDTIIKCMANNSMTLKNLYDAVKIVEDFYKRNAIIN